MGDIYGLDEQTGRRIAKATKWFEQNAQSWSGANGAVPNGGLQCVGAILGTKSGTLYPWSQAQPNSTTGVWTATSGGLSGTLTEAPAVYLDSSDSHSDLSGMYVILVRSNASDGKPVWIIAIHGTYGANATLTVVTDVAYNPTSYILSKTKVALTLVDGRVTDIGSATTTTITTADPTCS